MPSEREGFKLQTLRDQLREGLIVSCQPVPGGPLDRAEIIAAFALAALDGGAVGLRIEGVENVSAVRRVTDVPIIGLVKQDRTDTQVRITPTIAQAIELARAGADIIAFDATDRKRPTSVEAIIEAIKNENVIAMADCSTIADAKTAARLGCEIVGSTLSGYTGGRVPDEPDLELVKKLSTLGAFVVAEGRYHTPPQAKAALLAGADAVVVGSAITRPEHITSWFVDAVSNAASKRAVAQ